MSKGTHVPYIGSYIVDDFDTGSPDSWWDSEFKTNWTPTELPPASGDYVMVRGSDGTDQLTPANDLTNGFVFEMTMKCGATDVGPNHSIHIHVLDSSGVMQCGMYYRVDTGRINWFWSNFYVSKDEVTGIAYVPYQEIKVKVERAAGTDTVTGYYDLNDGNGWVAFSNPATVSGDVGLEVDGCQEHGITELDLWVGSGLPNP